MQPGPTFGYEQIVTELIRGILDTVADKPGLTPERKAAAQQTVVCSVMAYNPRDPIETMMAGQCIVYDHMLRDGARDMLRGQAELIKIKARPGILSIGKMFLATMDTLCRMQGRPENQLVFARQLPAVAEPPTNQAPAPDIAPQEPPVAVRNLPVPDDANAPTQPVAPRQAEANPPNARPAPSAPAGVRAAAIASTNQQSVPARTTNAHPAPVPARTPNPLTQSGQSREPLMSYAKVEEILLDGIDPATKQEIRNAVSRAVQGAM